MPASDLQAFYFLTLQEASGKPKLVGSRGSMVAKLKLKGIDGREPPGVEPAEGLTDWELFADSLGGGAWPLLVGGVICLVNSYYD